MSDIIAEKTTAATDDPFVVFLIGMRINKPLKIHRWLPVAKAMGSMISELKAYPDSDLLNVESWAGRTSIMVQYWRSFEALERYAKNADQRHRPAWAEFNRKIGSNGDVGIWHETYSVAPGQFEVVYNNMPLFGLAKATSSVPATGKRTAAAGRMAAPENER
ncbi:MAG: hypothetical protein ACJAYE_000772 [Candidatus Azotimanducaceae bacterium]